MVESDASLEQDQGSVTPTENVRRKVGERGEAARPKAGLVRFSFRSQRRAAHNGPAAASGAKYEQGRGTSSGDPPIASLCWE